MSVYWIGRAKVDDAERLKSYGSLVQKAGLIYQPEVLVRGGAYQILEGADVFDRWAVLRFTSMDHALTYYNSMEYQEALAHRQAATIASELALVEGVA